MVECRFTKCVQRYVLVGITGRASTAGRANVKRDGSYLLHTAMGFPLMYKAVRDYPTRHSAHQYHSDDLKGDATCSIIAMWHPDEEGMGEHIWWNYNLEKRWTLVATGA